MPNLPASRSREELIIECSMLGSWDWWLETNEVTFDSRWCQMVGLDPLKTEMKLSTWESRVHSEDLAKCYEDIKAYLDGKTPYYENIHRMKHANGSWVWILDRGQISERFEDGRPKRFTGTHLDITSYKESELLSQEIQKSAQIGGWELDLKTMKTKWTEQTYVLHKIPSSTPTDKIMGMNFYPEYERPRLEKLIGGCMSGTAFRSVFDFIDALGVLKKVEVTGKPIFSTDQKPLKIVGTFQDVSEIHFSHERLNEAQRIAKVGSWHFNLKTKEQIWTSEQYRIFEIQEDLPQSKLNEIYRSRIHPDDIQKLDKALDQALAEGTDFIYDHRILLDAGQRIKYVRVIGKVNHDSNGTIVSASGTCQDITERVETEREYQFTLDTLGFGIWKFNPITQALYWDDSLYNLYELDPKNFSGHYQAWESTLTEDSKAKAVKDLQDALKGAKEFNTSFEIKSGSGKRKVIGGRAQVIRNNKGEPIRMVGVNWDKTKESDLEEKLEYEKTKAIHNAKLASLGEMAAGIAHEINNPLAIIQGNANLISRRIEDDSYVKDKLKTLIKAIERITKIVNGLRKFSRSSELRETKVNSVLNMVNEAITLNESRFKKFEIELKINIPPTLEIDCDEVEIQQVLVNLINNSIDAIKDRSEKWISIFAEENPSQMVLSIQDSGDGITPEIEKRLFQPFFTTKPVGQGTGLGLSISKGILEQNLATIALNRSSKNTCFEIRFQKKPAARSEN